MGATNFKNMRQQEDTSEAKERLSFEVVELPAGAVEVKVSMREARLLC